MLSVTCSGFKPTYLATAIWSPVWNCSPFQISQLSAVSLTTQFKGSIAACARYGNSNTASSFFAAPSIARPASPSLRAALPGVPARRLYSAISSGDEPLNPDASSHSTFSASRPFFAAQNVVAMIATPVGISTTKRTPGMPDTLLASKPFSRWPKRGACATTAVSMSGSFTSCVKDAVPLDFAFESVRGTCLPMNTKSFASLSLIALGTGCFPAASASSPKVAFLPLACDTTPFCTRIASAGTFHCSAAAATSIARAAAPACRYCSNELAIAVEPPVPCAGPHSRLL